MTEGNALGLQQRTWLQAFNRRLTITRLRYNGTYFISKGDIERNMNLENSKGLRTAELLERKTGCLKRSRNHMQTVALLHLLV